MSPRDFLLDIPGKIDGKWLGFGQVEAGGVGIWWVGCGSDVGPVGTDRARFGRSAVVREVGCANF